MLIQSTLLPKQKQQNQKTDKKFHWSSVKKKNENFYRYTVHVFQRNPVLFMDSIFSTNNSKFLCSKILEEKSKLLSEYSVDTWK